MLDLYKTKRSPRFPMGRGNCRECGGPRYREGLCRTHLFAKRKEEYRRARQPREKVCPSCQKKFLTTKPLHKYCGPKCCEVARWKRERKADPRIVKCANCAVEFMQEKWFQRYCSARCNERGSKPLQYKLRMSKGMIDAVCERCGIEFKHKARSSERKARFCTTKCWYLANCGTANPLKREGVFHVPPDKVWREICRIIRTRDDEKCTACQSPRVHRKAHPVDHIVPRRLVHSWGNDPHQLCNLTTLCRSCHGKKGMAENKILRGDFVGFIAALRAMNYPMDRVRTAFIEFGLPRGNL